LPWVDAKAAELLFRHTNVGSSAIEVLINANDGLGNENSLFEPRKSILMGRAIERTTS